ncbi:sensor domain-containing diguanylate cyclase [Duganella radicis]|uniref:Diguanylate cyclase n=1 Tax=Duganella radicis TaxID=551988 RepID=A0A6L6PF78_9BURK|nr:sensor domain-containing diguanylate cyclase [Duganella radicis]MTV37674.1 diguanylate cyclase [Duganella radicis]
MEKTLHELAGLLLDVVFLVREDGRIAFVNHACTKVLGYAPDEMIGRTIQDFIHPDDLPRTRTEMAEVAGGRAGYGFENRYLRKDGSAIHFQWTAFWSPKDQLRVGVARDVSERKRSEARQAALLALSTAAHRADALNSMFSAFDATLRALLPVRRMAAVLEPDQRLTYLSDGAGWAETDGWHVVPMSTPGAAFGQLRLDLAEAAILQPAEQELLQFAASQAAAAIERFALQADLAHAARYDELTGLPNRRLFQDRMRLALARSRREHAGGAVLFIDLDDFKCVNDQHGHAAGDQLLRAVAQRIQSCVREADTVARLGGDEFVVLLEEVADAAQVRRVADKICKALAEPVALGAAELPASASIGVAMYPQQGEAVDDLMRHADQAMYASKARRKAGCRQELRYPVVNADT